MTNPEPVTVWLDPDSGEIIYLDSDANVDAHGAAGSEFP